MTVRAVALPRSGTAPRLTLGRELSLALAVFAIYSLVNAAPIEGRTARAADNGRSILSLEQALHIDIERALNHWLAGQSVWRTLANYEYALTYILSALIMLVYLYRRRPDRYRAARNAFALINLVAAVTFALYPVEPPRLAGLGYLDTVKLGNTWGSWGTPMVDHANQLAAMPSLHVAWALWVSVELARLSARKTVQAVSAAHIVLTLYVIMATGNHYLLDAVGAVALVWLCVGIAERRTARAAAERVPAADAFFLAVESPADPQHVGGLVLLDTAQRPVTREDLIAAVQRRLDELPRFRQRLSQTRWRRARWVDHPALDWEWHVPVHRLTGVRGGAGVHDAGPAGEERLAELVAELQSAALPRDRPLWRLMLVEGVAPGRSAAVFLMHHVVADGIGVVLQALRLMEPAAPPAESPLRPPGALRAAAGVAVGLGQLATDGRQGLRLPAAGRGERRFGTLILPFDLVRKAAKMHGVRVSDVVLCAVAGGLRRAANGAGRPGFCRVAVPLMMRTTDTPPEGNYTAAVMVDLPLDGGSEAARLAEIARRSQRLYTGTRALASRFVMNRLGQVLPPPVHARFARTVYGGRFFQAVVSNLPGPDLTLRLGGARLAGVFPILPLAPRAPLAVGALRWDGELNFGVSVDPALTDDAEVLATAMRQVIVELIASGAEPEAGAQPEAGAKPEPA